MSLDPEKFIGTQLRVKLNDSRILDGVLTVIDPFGNLLLGEVSETSTNKLDETQVHKRQLDLVSVPRDSIAQVLVDQKAHKYIFGESV